MQQPQTPFSKPGEKRGENGNPQGLKRLKEGFRKRFGSPFVRVTENAEQVSIGDVDQRQTHNDLVPWFVLLAAALILVAIIAGAALALSIRSEMTRERDMELMGRVIKAEVGKEYAQAVAKAQAEATAAAVVSDTWRNRVNKLEAEANANRRR